MADDQFTQKRGLRRYHDFLEDDEDDDGSSGEIKSRAMDISQEKRGLQRDHDFDDEDDDGSSGGIKPRDVDIFHTRLKQETVGMENERRRLEQSGHRQFGQVNAREKSDNPTQGNTAGLGAGIKAHPLLQTQRFDGVDSSLNPAPPDNPAALAEFENERAEQEKEKQLRLGNELTNSKKYTSTPTLTR